MASEQSQQPPTSDIISSNRQNLKIALSVVYICMFFSAIEFAKKKELEIIFLVNIPPLFSNYLENQIGYPYPI